ncbi:hypothetical protein F5B17DRAFT_190399 [Nemania serpens]|nr:hypothetical protein F5B17DRAFT_190399 [Nemania serpens]
MPLPRIDPRKYLTARGEPEQRQKRKELEKEHSVSLLQVAQLGLIGLTMAWNIEKQVEKHEKKKEQEEAEQRRPKDREHRRRRGESASRDRTHRSRHDYAAAGDRSESERRGRHAAGAYARDPRRHQSMDYRAGAGAGAGARYDDRRRDPIPRQEPRDHHRYYAGPPDYPTASERPERIRRRRDSR